MICNVMVIESFVNFIMGGCNHHTPPNWNTFALNTGDRWNRFFPGIFKSTNDIA